MQFWQPGRNFCCHKSKKFLFQVRIKGKLTKLSKISFIRSMILWRLRVQFSFLLSLPKTFPPSTVNVRSKFWGNWKKKRAFKILIFYWSYEMKIAFFNFDIPPENFLAKHSKCSFEVPKSLKKKRPFKKNFYSKCSFGQVECSFKKKVEIFPPIFEKKFLFSLFPF